MQRRNAQKRRNETQDDLENQNGEPNRPQSDVDEEFVINDTIQARDVEDVVFQKKIEDPE